MKLIARDPRIGRRRWLGQHRKTCLEAVEAVVAPDFFDEINFADEVDTERRRDDIPAVSGRANRQSQTVKNARDVGVGHRDAEERGESRAAQMERQRLARRRIAVDNRSGHLARADDLHERDRALDRGERAVDVGTTLEPGRRFGLQVQLRAGTAHGRGLEVRALEDDRCG